MSRKLTTAIALLLSVTGVGIADAHFPWLAINEQGNAIYFFGETPADRMYKLPDSVTKAELTVLAANGDARQVDWTPVETDDLLGMSTKGSLPKNSSLASKVTYGVYHGSRLDYYTQHVGGRLPNGREGYAAVARQLDLHAQPVDTDEGVDIYVLWKGEPLVGAKVRLFCEEGHEEGTGETDESGKVSFNDKQVEDGLNGIVVGHTQEGASGKLDDQPYGSVSHFLTMTFADPQDFE